MLNSFANRLEELSGEYVAVSRENLSTTLSDMLREVSGQVAYQLPQSVQKLFINVDALNIAKWTASKSELKKQLANCKTGIVYADYLLNDTGTLVLLQPGQPSRLLTLLPEWLIVIVSEKNALPGLPALYQLIDADKDVPFFITGPSRTADIEKQLVLGVHGPKRLTAIVVRDDQAQTES